MSDPTEHQLRDDLDELTASGDDVELTVADNLAGGETLRVDIRSHGQS